MIYGAGRPHLGFQHLRMTAVPVPPRTEQHAIVSEAERRLAAAGRLAAALNRQSERTRALRQSLLREAFAGTLVPQDPMDEPASVLLKCIRVNRNAEVKKPKVKPMSRSKVKSVRRPLLDVLREHKTPMSPEQLFREAGFQPAQADLFYRELISLRKILCEKRPSVSKASDWPHRTPVTLQLKEG